MRTSPLSNFAQVFRSGRKKLELKLAYEIDDDVAEGLPDGLQDFSDGFSCAFDDATVAAGFPVTARLLQAGYPSVEDERLTVVRMRGGDSRARDALVTAHIGLVKHIAKSYRSHRIGYDDLVQEGLIGLIYAVDRFDPDRGCRLSSYAGLWIRSFLQRAIIHARFIRIPDQVAKTIQAQKKKRDESGVAIRSSVGIVNSRMDAALSTSDWVQSLDTPDDEFKPPDAVDESTPQPDAACESARLNAAIHETLSTLTPAQREVLVARYGIHGRGESTLEDIGSSAGTSREGVRKHQVRALSAMRKGMERSGWSALDCAG